MAKKKDYKIKNADTIKDAEIEINTVKMTKQASGEYSVRVTYWIYADETNLSERKPIPIYEIRNFTWDGTTDFNTLSALDEF